MTQNETMFYPIKIPLLLLLLSQFSYAADVTIKKVKGRQAVIETDSILEEGQTYQLLIAPISMNGLQTTSQSRENSLHLGAHIQMLNGTNVQDHRMNLNTRYGWNFETFEFGPSFSFQSVDLGAGADSDFYLGGYFDYNLSKNKSTINLVWGPTISVDMGTKQFKSGGSVGLFKIESGVFLSWFLFNSTTALRIQADYKYEKVATTTSETTLTGFKTQSFLIFYF